MLNLHLHTRNTLLRRLLERLICGVQPTAGLRPGGVSSVFEGHECRACMA